MGLFKMFQKGKEALEPNFRVADGKIITPEEYGYLSVAVGINSASESFDNWFLQDQHTNKMYLSELVKADRFLAEVAISALFVGVYLHYIFYNLKITEESIVKKIMQGIDDGYKNVKSADGNNLSQDLRYFILKQATSYVNLIKEDFRANANFNEKPSSAQLIKNILMIVSNGLDKDDVIRLTEEVDNSTKALLLKEYIVSDALAILVAIADEKRIEFVMV